MFTSSLVAAAFAVLSQSISAPIATAELHARLKQYEARAAGTGHQVAAELAQIANAVLLTTAASNNADAVIHTCSSAFFKEAGNCATSLWQIAKRATAALAHRANAAKVLAARGDKQAKPYLLELVKSVPPDKLAASAAALLAIPAERAVPILAGMLQSGKPAAELSACRTLAQIDDAESGRVINAFLTSAPRGTPSWYACTIAAATLGDAEARRMTRFIHTYLADEDLIAAAEVLQSEDPELATSLLLQTTRQGNDFSRLDAADHLITMRPDLATDIMEFGLKSTDAMIRAAALELHRNLHAEPSRKVRALLLDPNPLVQLRAAETILAWETRQRRAGG